MDNYFPYHSLDQNDNANLFFHVNAGFHLLRPHLPLGPKAEEEQALAFVPHPTVIRPAVPVQPVTAHLYLLTQFLLYLYCNVDLLMLNLCTM